MTYSRTSDKYNSTTNNNLTDSIEIFEEYPNHYYRTEIPNIIFDMNMDSSWISVYCTLKRIAGDRGVCFKSIKNLAKQCGLSESTTRTVLNNMSLETIFHVDDERFQISEPLIKITKRRRKDGGDDTSIITINPIWELNGEYYRNKKKGKQNSFNKEGGVNLKGGGCKFERGGGVNLIHEEEPIEEEPFKKKIHTPKFKISQEAKDCVCFFSEFHEKEGTHITDMQRKQWTKDFTAMHEVDKIPWDEIKKIIEYAHLDDFWQSRTLTAKNLRKNALTIKLQMKQAKKAPNEDHGFENGKTYGKYVCEIDDKEIHFRNLENGTFEYLLFSDKDFAKNLKGLCKRLKITS